MAKSVLQSRKNWAFENDKLYIRRSKSMLLNYACANCGMNKEEEEVDEKTRIRIITI